MTNTPAPPPALLASAEGEPVTDLDHARYDRDGWMESALRAQGYVGELQGRLAAALARAERAEKALADLLDGITVASQNEDADWTTEPGLEERLLGSPDAAETAAYFTTAPTHGLLDLCQRIVSARAALAQPATAEEEKP